MMGYTNHSEVCRALPCSPFSDIGGRNASRTVMNIEDVTTTDQRTAPGHPRLRGGQERARKTAKSGALVQKVTIIR